MQISNSLLTYLFRLGDEDAGAALQEWNRMESETRPIPHIEAHFCPPDLFVVCAPNLPNKGHTNPGMPAFKSRHNTLTGIPLPRVDYPLSRIEIIYPDSGDDT